MELNIEENKRYLAIDNFRGIVIIFLAWYLFLNKFVNVPVVLKHALDTPGIYLADIGAPCFMLAMSLSAVIVFDKGKRKEGLAKTNIKFVKRYFTIIGVGFSVLAIQFALFGTLAADLTTAHIPLIRCSRQMSW